MLTLEVLNLATAPPAHLRSLAHHLESIRAERMPSDPPLDAETVIAGLQRPDPAIDRHHVLLWQDSQVVARASVTLPKVQNIHQADIELTVLAAYRNRGLARRLLMDVARLAEQADRQVLLTNASSRLPSGEAVLCHLGAQLVMQQQFMELDLQSLNPQQLTDWVNQSAEAAPQYRVWSHLGPYPQDRLPAIAPVYDVMQTAPQGTRAMQAARMTSEDLQKQDERLLTGGHQRLTTFAEHCQSGALVAFTELLWDVKRPTIMIQHGTAVQPEHRRHSLGRWIKAANLRAAERLNPAGRVVRAGNTDDNTGMLRINLALGFRAYLTHTDWQLDLNHLWAYLHRQRSGVQSQPLEH